MQILNRFEGTGPKMSATEVRDALVQGRSISELIPAEIAGFVREQFGRRWEELKRC